MLVWELWQDSVLVSTAYSSLHTHVTAGMRSNELTLSSILLLVYNAGTTAEYWIVPPFMTSTNVGWQYYSQYVMQGTSNRFREDHSAVLIRLILVQLYRGGTAVLFSTELNTRSYEGIPLRGHYRYGPDMYCSKFPMSITEMYMIKWPSPPVLIIPSLCTHFLWLIMTAEGLTRRMRPQTSIMQVGRETL